MSSYDYADLGRIGTETESDGKVTEYDYNVSDRLA